MKCPKCQAEINNNARFCTKCGCNLAVEMAKVKSPEPVATVSCTKCGAAIKPGAKFCVKCGQAISSASDQGQGDKTLFLYNDAANNGSDRTVVIDNGNTPQGNQVQGVAPVFDDIVPPDNINKKDNSKKDKGTKEKNRKQKEPKATNGHQGGEKAGKGLVIAAVVLLVLVVLSGAACYMVWNGTLSLPAIAGWITVDKDKDSEEESSSIETESEDIPGSDAADVDAEGLFAEADALLAEGKNQITIDAEILDGMANIRSAMDQFADKAQEAGDIGLAADRIADAYASYVTAVTKRRDMMVAQGLSGAIYNQVISEIKDAETLAEEMTEKGYEMDTASLKAVKDAFNTSYTEQIIKEFDDFTNRATWSRTEAWNLMSGVEGVFDHEDLDNPLRLRYAYALSWWIQKQIESDLENGTTTEKAAAIRIAGSIEQMDYNPMMLAYYITYMEESGEDCTQVLEAYTDIVRQIGETQGIWIGEDIDIERFWYFNDFGEYSVDDRNGVTPENRQWIRDRMRSVEFISG